MFSSVRVKIATTLLVATAIAGGGVAVAGGAQAASPGRMVEGTWVNGYLGTMDYRTGSDFDWGYAWDRCHRAYPGTRSVKYLKMLEPISRERTMIFACSDAARP